MNDEQDREQEQQDELNNTKERDHAMLKRHVAQLAEHFETVQIFATRHSAEHDGTVGAQWGEGNWYARYGQVKEWVVREERGFE